MSKPLVIFITLLVIGMTLGLGFFLFNPDQSILITIDSPNETNSTNSSLFSDLDTFVKTLDKDLPESGEWSEAYMRGKKGGFEFSISEDALYQGQSCKRTYSRRVGLKRLDGIVKKSSMSKMSYTKDNRYLYTKEIHNDNNQISMTECFYTPSKIKIIKTLEGNSQEKSFSASPQWRVGFDGSVLKKMGIAVGKRYELKVFSIDLESEALETAHIVEKFKYTKDGKQIDAFKVLSTMSNLPGFEGIIIIGVDGQEYEMRIAQIGLVVKHCSKEKALMINPEGLREVKYSLKANAIVIDSNIAENIIIEIQKKEINKLSTFQDSSYQRIIDRKPDSILVQLNPFVLDGYKPINLPLASPGKKDYLKASLLPAFYRFEGEGVGFDGGW